MIRSLSLSQPESHIRLYSLTSLTAELFDAERDECISKVILHSAAKRGGKECFWTSKLNRFHTSWRAALRTEMMGIWCVAWKCQSVILWIWNAVILKLQKCILFLSHWCLIRTYMGIEIWAVGHKMKQKERGYKMNKCITKSDFF